MVDYLRERYEDARRAGFIDRVLIVDEAESAAHLKSVLVDHGFTVVSANDGGQAHASFTLQKPDFVILELLLPGESGFEICERLKKLNRAVPVLALTEIDLDCSRNLAARVGVDGYLTKPFDPEVLLSLMKEVNDAVWERTHVRPDQDQGTIRFYCRCGTKLTMKLKDKGKAMYCPGCKDRVDVPEWVSSRRAEFFIPRDTEGDWQPAKLEPLKFITIRCQHCGTYYKLRSPVSRNARVCPKCGERQMGPLSIVGAPLSRAALASSRRVLIIRSGKNKGKKLLLPDSVVVIGRSPNCHIRSTSRRVSRRHCLLEVGEQGLLVRDLGSHSGTFVNGKRITSDVVLKPGDILRVGSMELQLAGGEREVHLATGSEMVFTDDDRDSDPSVSGTIRQEEFESTAEEAAHVIRLHWESIRKKARRAAEDLTRTPVP